MYKHFFAPHQCAAAPNSNFAILFLPLRPKPHYEKEETPEITPFASQSGMTLAMIFRIVKHSQLLLEGEMMMAYRRSLNPGNPINV
jgi:hypothetical protein